jgi:hypothetical protein
MRSYAVPGSAGQLLAVELSGDASIDPYLRLIAPDGSASQNDDDPFGEDGTARVWRLLQADGTYFAEVSTSPQSGSFDPSASNGFVLRARTCPTRPLSPGITNSFFGPDDCLLANGRPYEAFTLQHDGASLAVASFSFGDNVCLLALLPNGDTIPREGCATNVLEVPLVRAGTYAVIAASETTTPEPYSFLYRRCPAGAATYGDRKNGTLSAQSCLAADGVRADWYWVAGPEKLVQFNDGVGGAMESLFRGRVAIVDGNGFSESGQTFATDAASMLPLAPRQLGALVRVRGVDGSGPYSFLVDSALKRQ